MLRHALARIRGQMIVLAYLAFIIPAFAGETAPVASAGVSAIHAKPAAGRENSSTLRITIPGVSQRNNVTAVAPDDPPGVSHPQDASRRWLRRPVSFEARKAPLANALRDFASGQGVACQVSSRLTGTLTGVFVFEDPLEFLDLLGSVKHMNWYFDGGTVHFFSSNELETRLLNLQGKSEDALRNALSDLGLLDSRFEWRSGEDGRMILVHGPKVYLDRIADVLATMRETAEADKKLAAEAKAEIVRERKLEVFRLKHAWAAERTITSGDVNTIVPGIADILRQILTESPLSDPAPTTANVANPREPRFRMGTGIVGRTNTAANQASGASDASGVPFIQADIRINAVLVWDYEENLERYREIITALDRPLDLVEIRAAIIDVETDRTRELGVNWEYRGDRANWQNNAATNPGDAVRSLIPVIGDGFQYATIYKHGLDAFMARVSAVEKEGGANILSRPTVLTQDNIQAILEHTDTFYVRLQGDNEVDLADITTGLTLKVTPHVIQTADDVLEGIQLAVYIVNGTNTADTSSGSVDNLPRVKQSTISTQAVVGEGEALVIGGYYNETRSVTRTGVPVLSKIPGLGALFRNKQNVAVKSERLFVLSPRLVRPYETQFPSGSEGERVMIYSPGVESLQAPAHQEPVPGEKKRSSTTRMGGRR